MGTKAFYSLYSAPVLHQDHVPTVSLTFTTIIDKRHEYNPRVANTRHWTNVGLMLGRRRRRRPNINPTLAQCLVFAGEPT